MPTREPLSVRRGMSNYGSAWLFVSGRLASGSTVTTDEVRVKRLGMKSFAFRGNVRGSFFTQGNFSGVPGGQYFTVDQGTFPASGGSLRTSSSREGFGHMRAVIRNNGATVGSFSAFFGGYPASMM